MNNRNNNTTGQKESELQREHRELLVANEDLFQMMEMAKMGNWEVDLTKPAVYWSPVIYDIHEVPQGTKILLEDGINFYHPDYRNAIKTAVERAINEGESWDMELQLLTAKGKTIWVRAIGRPIEENGEIKKLKGIFQDINEQKLRQERIEESEQLLMEGQEIGRFGNWRWDMVRDELYWSDELYKVFGQKPGAFETTYEALRAIVHPEDREKLDTDVRDAIHKRRPHDLIHRIVWPNGETRYVHERGIVYYSPEGNPLRMAGTTQDVTERIVAERELLESEAALKAAEKIAQLGNWKWYIDEDVHVWSDERYRILGYEPHEVEPSMALVIASIHKDDVQRVSSTIEEAIREERDYVLEYRLLDKSGKEKVVREQGKWLEEHNAGRKNIYLGTIQDITRESLIKQELVDSLNALKRSNSELKNFAYVASHDLQEPLRVINSYLQLIELKYKNELDEEGREYIQNTLNASVRMKTLINDLLALSRVETTPSEHKPVDCQKLVEQVCEDLQLSIEEAGAKVDFWELPTVNGDEVQLRQLFQNLIGNAIKFRRKEETPKVLITTTRLPNKFKFSIKDNGIGIAKEYFQRIFDIFKRLHTREEFKGTGIGLAICKKIVEQHGGEIGVVSKPGEGSEFIFTIDLN